MSKDNEAMREAVKDTYSDLAIKGQSCCGPKQNEIIRLYSEDELAQIPEDVKASNCSCGNPVALAELRPGQVVVDLGSGAGMDVFLSAKRVGPQGRAYGIDATPEMVWKARRSAKRLCLDNAEFRLGEIEHMPIESGSVDVVISNCVINLSPDKEQVFKEAYRILRTGGKLCVSDRVLLEQLPEKARDDPELWGGCVAGAVLEDEYLKAMKDAGFEDVEIAERRSYELGEAKEFAENMAAEKRSKGVDSDMELLTKAFLCIGNDRIVAYKR